MAEVTSAYTRPQVSLALIPDPIPNPDRKVRSHQHILDRLLGQHAALYALKVMILDKEEFPQGQVFHHNKALMKQFVDKSKVPYVFHMCWTASKVNKLKYDLATTTLTDFAVEMDITLEDW